MPEMSPLGASFSRHLCFFCHEGNVTPVTPTHIYRKYHISTRFLIKIISFHFPPKEKIYFLAKKKYHLSIYYKKDHVQARSFWKDHLFRKFEENIIFPGTFLGKIIFLLCLKNKVIFSGKRHIAFPNNTRKIIFQCDFFEKTMF